jgi:hypothetical protein
LLRDYEPPFEVLIPIGLVLLHIPLALLAWWLGRILPKIVDDVRVTIRAIRAPHSP